MSNKLPFILLVEFLFFLSPSIANAQVIINEFLPNHSSGDDWVELYSPIDLDISGWILDDEGTATDMANIPAGTFIGPSTSSFYTIDVGTRLNQDEDTVYLYTPSRGSVVDSRAYSGTPGTDVSIGRFPDGVTWGLCTPTKNTSNSSCTFPTPSPTPTPTPTSTPTLTPTSTPTKTPTPTPTKTPTPKPSPKEEIVLESQTSSNDQVLGLKEQLKTPEPEEEETPKKKFPVFPVILIIVGAGLMGFAGYSLFKKMKTEGYNNQSEENN